MPSSRFCEGEMDYQSGRILCNVVELALVFFAGVAVTFFAGVDRPHTVGVGRQLRLALQPGLAPSSGVFYQRSLMTKRLQENGFS